MRPARIAFWLPILAVAGMLPLASRDEMGPEQEVQLPSAAVGPYRIEEVVAQGRQAASLSISLLEGEYENQGPFLRALVASSPVAQSEDKSLTLLAIAETEPAFDLVVTNTGDRPLRESVVVRLNRTLVSEAFSRVGRVQTEPPTIARVARLTVEAAAGATARHRLTFQDEPVARVTP